MTGNSRSGRVLDGAGFALAMMSTWFVAYIAEYFFKQLPIAGLTATTKGTIVFAAWVLADILPLVPLFVMIINRTSVTDARRYFQLLAVMLAVWVYWAGLDRMLGGTPKFELFRLDNIPCAFEAALIFAAVAYRSSARSATGELLQRQIARVALDADVKRARLRLLRAQIEPHFLFNTLATVRTLVHLDRHSAVEMIDNLMRYLSEALPKLRQDDSSLAEELQLVAAYLRIHQIRMGTRLSYALMVPEQLGAERIPTMLLLTLVENALKHGINPAVAGGLISVSAARERTGLVLKVSDTGQGLAVTQGHGMGLANIRRRLSMLYGDAAIFSLARNASHGMVATVTIPLCDAR